MTFVESQIPIPGPGLSPLKVTSSESWVGWTKPTHVILSRSGMGPELIRSVCGGETPKSLISWVLQNKYWGSCLTLEARSMITVLPGLLTWTGCGSVSSSPQIIARGWPNRAILAPESSCPGEFPLVELRLRVNDCNITFFLFIVPSAASKRKAKYQIF